LAGFVSKLRVVFKDIEVGLDYEPERGLADNGDTAFTSRMFDAFMKRSMPGDDWLD